MNNVKASYFKDTFGVEHITLPLLEVAVQEQFSKYGLEALATRATIEERVGFMLEGMCYRLRAYVTGKDDVITNFHTVKYPASWWQHLKEEHFPAWLKLKFPIIYTQETFEITRHHTKMCPHLPIKETPDNKKHVDWLFLEEPFGNAKFQDTR